MLDALCGFDARDACNASVLPAMLPGGLRINIRRLDDFIQG